jgi:hypothetical protein
MRVTGVVDLQACPLRQGPVRKEGKIEQHSCFRLAPAGQLPGS